jgi:hypothetical protein
VIEIIGICMIIGIQVYFFYATWQQIDVYKHIFPEVENFSIINVGLLQQYLEQQPAQLLANLDKYVKESEPKITETELITASGILIRPPKFEEDRRIYVDLLQYKEGNDITNKIVYALNTYLLRNRGVASDFHLIKDVVERNSDVVEGNINQTISLPLYLGLLGTFLGIVFGLFQISGTDFSANADALNEAIALLLDGVKIAMIASFCGLLLMVLNTGVFFKGAKAKVEEKKNGFYTFIQTELLPLLNQGINSTLASFQSNMHKFNDEFKSNLTKLDSVMGKNYDALVAQEKVLTTLQKMDITEFAKANVKVLHELQYSVDKFSEFNKYLNGINEILSSTNAVSANLNEAIARTDNFYKLGNQIVEIFSENQQLIGFLQNHYNALDDSHQLITKAVNEVGDTLLNSLHVLKDFTQERITEIQKITLKEIDLMREEYPERWKKLEHLSFLEPVNKNLNDIKMSNAAQIGSVTNEIREVNAKLSKAVLELEAIKKSNTDTFTSRISHSIGKVFRKKKTEA